MEDLNRVIILDSCARPAISRKLIRERETKAKQRKKTRHLNGLLMVVGDALVSCFFGVKQINAQKTCKELLQTSKADRDVSHFFNKHSLICFLLLLLQQQLNSLCDLLLFLLFSCSKTANEA